jgi:hypothetical protein
MERNDRDTLLHLLRNPWGWSDDTVREARLKAADELERLWRADSAQRLNELVGLLREAAGPMSRGHWSSDFRDRVYRALELRKRARST